MKILKLMVRKFRDYGIVPDELGRYDSRPGAPDRTIDREALKGKMTHELQYFIAVNGPEETGNPNSVMQDYERMEAFEAGEWHYLCFRAEAQVQLTEDGPIQTIVSGGINAVASDCESHEIEELIAEEKKTLIGELDAIGLDFEEGDDGIYIEEEEGNKQLFPIKWEIVEGEK